MGGAAISYVLKWEAIVAASVSASHAWVALRAPAAVADQRR